MIYMYIYSVEFCPDMKTTQAVSDVHTHVSADTPPNERL